jgi:hypothetical protein
MGNRKLGCNRFGDGSDFVPGGVVQARGTRSIRSRWANVAESIRSVSDPGRGDGARFQWVSKQNLVSVVLQCVGHQGAQPRASAICSTSCRRSGVKPTRPAGGSGQFVRDDRSRQELDGCRGVHPAQPPRAMWPPNPGRVLSPVRFGSSAALASDSTRCANVFSRHWEMVSAGRASATAHELRAGVQIVRSGCNASAFAPRW